MRRHELDAFSLVAGAVFVAVATGHLLDEAVGINFDGHWVLPVALVAIGVAGLASLARRDRAAVRAPAQARTEPATGTATDGEPVASSPEEAGPGAASSEPATEPDGDERSEDR